MMTTRKNCHLICLICRLSGSRELVVRQVQVLGVSCVSHDAVRWVPDPRVLLLPRPTMERFVVSSLRVVLAPITPFSVPTRCSGFVSDLPNQIPFVPRGVSLTESLARRLSTMPRS